MKSNSSEEIKAFGSCLDRAIPSCGESAENRAGGSLQESCTGILPIAKSTSLGWSLPGHGEAYQDCGEIRFRGCLNVEFHQEALDRDQRGKAFVQAYRRTCGRKECPKCYESWASLEARRAEYRLGFYRGRWGKPIHLSVNPASEIWDWDYHRLKSYAYKALKCVGISGGCLIYHPFRQNESGEWFFSPHFHVLGYGYHRGNRVPNMVVKNHGVRKSVRATLLYQLSHAGVHESIHTVTWFGCLSYNKLKVPPMPDPKPKCPLCGEDLVPLLYCGQGEDPPPLEDGAHFLDPCDWMESPGRFGRGS